MKYKTIIFDWSGTLSDDRIPVYEANKHIFKKFNKKIPPFNEFFGQTVGTFQEFVQSFGIQENIERLSALYAETYKELTTNGITPLMYKDVQKVLAQINKNGRILAVLSSHPQKSLEEEAQNHKIDNHFIILRGDSRNKPSDLFGLCTLFNLNSRSTVYVGDMTQDIQAAKQSGLISAAVSTGYHHKEKLLEAKPHLGVFNNLGEFAQAIL